MIKQAASGIVHTAGEVIADDRNAMMPVGQQSPRGFPKGPVTMIGNMTAAYDDGSLPHCSNPQSP